MSAAIELRIIADQLEGGADAGETLCAIERLALSDRLRQIADRAEVECLSLPPAFPGRGDQDAV